ncbi:MAG: serine protease [Microthrixaceae bacterium]|nr:serine protease [Acidimicrobiales bacterium]MCB9403394.1 serine protease [Microthrixaceae bacterium]
MRARKYLTVGVVTLGLLASACGSSGGGDAKKDDAKGGDKKSSQSSGAVGLDGVQSAVVQIIAAGSFVEPSESIAASETYEGKSSGSGFIIDPSGIVVTNNHVVTGNASLEVYVDGKDDPVSAKVLGVSECSDLAVIDLEGDGYPFMAWSDKAPKVGLEVRAAGFPLGDPEFTMTNGIISKADAAGDTNWASVDSVVEHDANIQPGNSGGPLVDASTGKVVAVNYAGGDVGGTGTSQFFAISAELAKPLVDKLKKGDVDSLGVNGRAILDEESGLSGIWVSGVDTNSPAGELGLQGGDIIEKIEGLSMGSDGTMADYCKVLRSRNATDKLAVQVLRFDEDVRMKGEFNGDELEAIESLGSAVEAETGPLQSGGSYSGYTRVSDDSGTISVEVPNEWSSVDGTPLTLDDGSQWANVTASTDVAAYMQTWNTPGVSITAAATSALPDTDPTAIVNMFAEDALAACTNDGQQAYDDGLYSGTIQYLSNCGGSGASAVYLAATPADGSFMVLLSAQMASEADLAALDQIVATFIVTV